MNHKPAPKTVIVLLALIAIAIPLYHSCMMESPFLDAIERKIAEDLDASGLIPKYSVTYDGNGNTGGLVPVDTTAYKTGDTATVSGNTNGLIKTGFSFAGWNTAADGGRSDYIEGDTFIISAENIVLYAKWTLNQTFTVTYHGNGADGGSLPVDVNTYSPGDLVTILGPGTMTRSDYLFDGWCFDQGGGSDCLYEGDMFIIDNMDKTLYAQWIPANTVSTPQFDPSPGSYDIDKSVEITCITEGATIYYTTNGSDPDIGSTLYSSPFLITGSVSGTITIVKAMAVKAGMNDSNIGFATYTIDYLNTPSGITASDGTSTSAVTVSWTTTGAAEYYVYRNTDDTATGASLLADNVTGSSYNDTSASAGSAFYYFVRAYNPSSGALSDYSDSNSGFKKLSVPGSFTASEGSSTSQVSLSWTASSGATAYYIYRNTVNLIPGSALTCTANFTYNDTTATPGQVYFYWVRAYDSSPVQYSDYSSGNNTGFRKLSAPGGFTAGDGADTGGVGLDWDLVTGATHYYIYRNTIDEIPGTTLDSTTSSITYYYDTDAYPGTQYYYWIKAYDSSPEQYSDAAADQGYRRISAPANFQASDLLTTTLDGTTGQVYTFTIQGYQSSPSHYSPEASDTGYEN